MLPKKGRQSAERFSRPAGELQLWSGVHARVSDLAGGVGGPLHLLSAMGPLLQLKHWSSRLCCQEADARDRERDIEGETPSVENFV